MNNLTKFKYYYLKDNPGQNVRALQLSRETAPILFEFLSQYYRTEVRLKTDYLGSPTIFTYNSVDEVMMKTDDVSVLNVGDWVIWHSDDILAYCGDNIFKKNYKPSLY